MRSAHWRHERYEFYRPGVEGVNDRSTREIEPPENPAPCEEDTSPGHYGAASAAPSVIR